METLSPSQSALNLSPQLYYQLVQTLTGLLPPPLDDAPDAPRTRNLAAIAKVAALLPVNANEADLAAQCIAARAQAEDVMRLIRAHADNVALVIKLNAQYASMVRTSLSAQAGLLRVQAVRRKREAVEASASQDAWTQHIAERSMLTAADPDFERLRASPEAARGKAPEAARGNAPEAAPGKPTAKAHQAAPAQAPDAVPTPFGNLGTQENVSETNQNSHNMASETPMSALPTNQAADPAVMPRDAKAALANTVIAAAQAVATPGPRRETAPAAAQTIQPPRMADPRDKLLWADAMRHVSAEMIAGLSAIPPALRKQERMRARLLSSVASQITMQAIGTPAQRPIVAAPKSQPAGRR
jgi:hypothetical protein